MNNLNIKMMKTLIKKAFVLPLLTCFIGLTSCNSEDNDVFKDVEGEGTETINEIIVNPTNGATTERSLSLNAAANSTVKVKVNFTGDKTMRRIYTTKNTFSDGTGPQPFEFIVGDKKNDGSIDLGGDDKTAFGFTFEFDAPTTTNDVVEYVIWTTSGRGDFRDLSKRNAIEDGAFATIRITAGSGANQTGFRSFTQTILAAPLAEGTSESFISLFDENTHKIVLQNGADVVNGTFTEEEKAENAELSALWDFGYFYDNTNKSSFASASKYMEAFIKSDGSPVVDITNFTGLEKADLNNFYFKKSSLTVAEFEAISSDQELDFITKGDSEKVNNLVVNDIIEFVDQYGNKGLIKINRIKGTFNLGDEIEFDVKAQFNAVPIKG